MSVSKEDFIRLADLHLRDALILLKNDRFSGAYYLGGYSLECALKAVICDHFQHQVIPDKALVNAIYVHDLNKLVSLAGLKVELDQKLKDEEFASMWALASNWHEGARYEFSTNFDAHALLNCINNKGGILEWIKSHW